jgi:hypothetical protein
MCYALLILLSLTAFQETAIENSTVVVQMQRSLRLQSRRAPRFITPPPSANEPTPQSVHLDEIPPAAPRSGRPLYQARLRRFDSDQR